MKLETLNKLVDDFTMFSGKEPGAIGMGYRMHDAFLAELSRLFCTVYTRSDNERFRGIPLLVTDEEPWLIVLFTENPDGP